MMALAFKTYMISEYGCGGDGRAWRSSGRRLLPHAPPLAVTAESRSSGGGDVSGLMLNSGDALQWRGGARRLRHSTRICQPRAPTAASACDRTAPARRCNLHPSNIRTSGQSTLQLPSTPVHPTPRRKGEPIGPPRPGSLSFIHAKIDDSPGPPSRKPHTAAAPTPR